MGNNNTNLLLGHQTSSMIKSYATCIIYGLDKTIFSGPIGESAFNEHTADRRYTWAPIGAKAIFFSSYLIGAISILPYAIDGYLAWQVYQGSRNANRFMEFV